MNFNFPKWAWWILGFILVLVVVAIFKIDTGVNPQQGFHFNQGLIHTNN